MQRFRFNRKILFVPPPHIPKPGPGSTRLAFTADNGGTLNLNFDRRDANSTMMLRLDVPLN